MGKYITKAFIVFSYTLYPAPRMLSAPEGIFFTIRSIFSIIHELRIKYR